MARPKSDDKRAAILEAAIVLIAEQGVAATTGEIAKRAGVSHGVVFHYFPTKAELLNAVFLRLKAEIHDAALGGLPEDGDCVAQLRHMWEGWMRWGLKLPVHRRALERLAHEEVVSPDTRAATQAAMERGIAIVREVAQSGVFAGQPIEFVARYFDALATATMDAMIGDPKRAESYCKLSFEALLRALR